MEDPPPFRLAILASKKSNVRFKMGASIARRNQVLISAPNMGKTCPEFGSGQFGSLHAESNAIKKAVRRGIDLTGCDIYIYREGGKLAAPCKCCQALIDKYGIRNVHYSYQKVKN